MARRLSVAGVAAVMGIAVAGLGACQRAPDRVAAPLASAPLKAPVAMSPGTSAAAGRGLPDFTELVARNGPAVVNITVVERSRPASFEEGGPDDPLHDFLRRFGMPSPRGPQQPARGEGSGFIVAPDGYILTNAHVVADAREVTVRLTDRREFTAKVIGVDRRTDVAVIKIDGKDLPTVRIGDPSRLRPGEWVVAIGSPFGFDNSVTAGIVSAISRSLPDGQYTPFIQTDAAVNPGNSGGPLFNMAGEVVGMNSQIYSRTGGFMGISFAIPIDIATGVEDQLVKTGRVQRGRIGVLVQEVGQQLADSFGLDRPRGAIVAQVEGGGPAAKAGLKAGDVILAVAGQPIERSGQLSAVISQIRPGTRVELEVWRERASRKIEVEVGELKEGAIAANERGDAREGGKLGLSVRPLTPQEKRAAGLDGGLLVEDVAGPALEADVRPGDVIVGANGQRVASAEDLAAQTGKSKRSVALLVNRDGTTIFIPIKIG
ncbi:MAG TPA: DegQ family serine endoprotease [Steroidobacteraceae bacterium]|nr:DegQ family serine endoprotease [Steroidobacteraceae bacterium]